MLPEIDIGTRNHMPHTKNTPIIFWKMSRVHLRNKQILAPSISQCIYRGIIRRVVRQFPENVHSGRRKKLELLFDTVALRFPLPFPGICRTVNRREPHKNGHRILAIYAIKATFTSIMFYIFSRKCL